MNCQKVYKQAACSLANTAVSLVEGIVSFVVKNSQNVQIGIKASKSYITEGFTTLIDKDGYDFNGQQ